MENKIQTRLRHRVTDAIRRCTDKRHPNYKRYGGRGISVFAEWVKDRRLFQEYLKTLPGWDDPVLKMDRINNDGNYEPGNIRFVNSFVSMRNTRPSMRPGGGVSQIKSGKWRPQLMFERKYYYLGLHEKKEDALAALAAKRKELGI